MWYWKLHPSPCPFGADRVAAFVLEVVYGAELGTQLVPLGWCRAVADRGTPAWGRGVLVPSFTCWLTGACLRSGSKQKTARVACSGKAWPRVRGAGAVRGLRKKLKL